MPKQTKNMENQAGGKNIRLRLFRVKNTVDSKVSEAEAQGTGGDESTSSVETTSYERNETIPGVESNTDGFPASGALGSNAGSEIPDPQPTAEDYSSIDSFYEPPQSPPSSPPPVGMSNLMGYGQQAEFTNYIGRKDKDVAKPEFDGA